MKRKRKSKPIRKPVKVAPVQAPESGYISAEKLCALTGLTDRQHRNIAKAGFFPPPVDGQYQTVPTLRGMFKYYREMGERTRNRKDAIDEQKLRALKRENEEAEGRLTDTRKLAEVAGRSLIAIRDLIYQKMEAESPVSMAGLDVASARIIGRRLADELILKIQSVFKAWAI